ncbi:WUSCHEL-related homeobox 12 [Acorus calamus]|uniref:WUSCHEL-related homeobox 12 n=1 Tax=Acorus calamus TaxID=4465 RepID=A0AAV9F3M2_ACOCL|nr:WUSCHEL-related homeobox 12 [Acorus calamus]
MVNPPRDEIRRIRTRLQEYGQVGDANVFYWFQNRKSRSKHKNRQLQTTTNNRSHSLRTTSAATSSSSSTSSDKSSPDKHPILPSAAIDVPPTPRRRTAASHGGGYYFSPDYLSNLVQIPEHGLGLCSGLLTELISQGQVGSKKEELKMEVVHPGYPVIANASSVVPTTTTTTPTTTTALSDLQGMYNCGGVGEMGGDRVMVFINDVAFEIGVGPINLREAFGMARSSSTLPATPCSPTTSV